MTLAWQPVGQHAESADYAEHAELISSMQAVYQVSRRSEHSELKDSMRA